MKDSDIDHSDIDKTDENFWKDAKIVSPKNKRAITIRLDDNVIQWFKHYGPGYQTKINSVLKSFVDKHKKKQS